MLLPWKFHPQHQPELSLSSYLPHGMQVPEELPTSEFLHSLHLPEKIPGLQRHLTEGYLTPLQCPVVRLYQLLRLQVSVLQEMPYLQILRSLLPVQY